MKYLTILKNYTKFFWEIAAGVKCSVQYTQYTYSMAYQSRQTILKKKKLVIFIQEDKRKLARIA